MAEVSIISVRSPSSDGQESSSCPLLEAMPDSGPAGTPEAGEGTASRSPEARNESTPSRGSRPRRGRRRQYPAVVEDPQALLHPPALHVALASNALPSPATATLQRQPGDIKAQVMGYLTLVCRVLFTLAGLQSLRMWLVEVLAIVLIIDRFLLNYYSGEK